MLLREVLTSTPGAERKVCRCRQAFLPTSGGTQLKGRNHTHLTADKSLKSFLRFSPVNQQRGPLEHLSPGVSHCKHSTGPLTLLYWLPVLSQRASRALTPASYLGVLHNCSPTESPTQTCWRKRKSDLRPVHRRALDMTTSTVASTENWEETPWQASSKKVARP